MRVCIGKNEELGIMVFVDYIVVFFYFAVLIAVGVWYCKRAVKNLESYFLGGKRFIGRLRQCLGRFPLSISQAHNVELLEIIAGSDRLRRIRERF
jgi:hypothetical protein